MAELWLTPDQQRAIVAHALAEAPNEACGLLLGKYGRVETVLPTRNVANDPTMRYRVDDAEVVRHHAAIIGIYHSHPNGNPIPSRTDIQESWYSETVYVIVGLKNTQPRLAAWRFNHGRVDAVHLRTGSAPFNQPITDKQRPQQVAILLSAVIVLILMLVLSVALLPPPPPIP